MGAGSPALSPAQCNAARKPPSTPSGPRRAAHGAAEPRPAKGPHGSPPPAPLLSVRLGPGTPPSRPPEPLRTASGPPARAVGLSPGAASPFQVSGVLPLHGGADDGAARMRGSERGPRSNFRKRVARAPRPPEAMTVPRPARRGGGGGAAVTTVRPPAPPTAPKPQNTAAAWTRPETPPQPCLTAHAPAAPRQSAQAQHEAPDPGTNLTHHGAQASRCLRRV